MAVIMLFPGRARIAYLWTRLMTAGNKQVLRGWDWRFDRMAMKNKQSPALRRALCY